MSISQAIAFKESKERRLARMDAIIIRRNGMVTYDISATVPER